MGAYSFKLNNSPAKFNQTDPLSPTPPLQYNRDELRNHIIWSYFVFVRLIRSFLRYWSLLFRVQGNAAQSRIKPFLK